MFVNYMLWFKNKRLFSRVVGLITLRIINVSNFLSLDLYSKIEHNVSVVEPAAIHKWGTSTTEARQKELNMEEVGVTKAFLVSFSRSSHFEFRPAYRLSWLMFSRFSSFLPRKYRDSTRIRFRQFSPRLLPIHTSFINFHFTICILQCWKGR